MLRDIFLIARPPLLAVMRGGEFAFVKMALNLDSCASRRGEYAIPRSSSIRSQLDRAVYSLNCMRIVSLTFVALFFSVSAFAQNFVLVNGSVVDGTGKPRVLANVRIRDGRILDIGPFKPVAGEMLLDVKGMIVAPGFIDLSTLSPSAIQKDPAAASVITQGTTTAVLGSDGAGPYAVEDFMLPFDEKPPALNIATLVGHGTVRRQIMGPDFRRPATPDEVARMTELVSDAMKQGAFGLGSDLQQEPASFSTPEEVLALAKVAGKLGGTFVATLRNENEKVAEAVKEVIGLARDARIPVQVLTMNKVAIGEIDKARVQRVDIAADSYSFAQFAGDKSTTVERAIQRMSAAPAARMGLRERGILKKGAHADLAVFNLQVLSAGLKYVFVNGSMVVKDGQPTEARPGQALR
jgi:N-acyl-D-aspartate/D-glutamate deacylase